ncbi:hypothetical protein SEUCBS139899_004785 [Sporothrix eucalyptigena]|uniref:Protein kinase domain-containing protein n=1 Tax=Sporothrix eucalyptigena TaxID=1812306 RepID=A0ABP0C2R0_9PEZI
MDSPSDRQSLAHEASMYERLDGTGITPQFVGHVVNEDGSAIGFLIEYIPQDENERLNRQAMQACLEVLRHLHGQGLAHGDPHDGNCLLRVDRTAVLIDFELAQEAAPAGELVRDERIMDSLNS